jgi:DeoR/GlpR family transcriptional regulator of sugar metabolism
MSAQEMSIVLSVIHRTVQRDLSVIQKTGILSREGSTSARIGCKAKTRIWY